MGDTASNTPLPETDDMTAPASTSTPSDAQHSGLMRGMLVGLTLFFFLASFAQLYYLHSRIAEPPGAELTARLQAVMPQQPGAATTDPLSLYAALEVQALNRRYHQGNVLLMSRIWVSYLSFVTGMILCLMGASFILGRLREPVSNVGADSSVVKLSVSSSSPGIILACLGTVLIVTSIMTNHRIEVKDTSIYLGRYSGGDAQATTRYLPPALENTQGVDHEQECDLDPNGPQCTGREGK